MHHHVTNYASYELVDGDGVVVTARKQAFCLEDDEQVQLGAQPTGYSCANQGISRGWADVYSALPGVPVDRRHRRAARRTTPCASS